MKDLKFELAPKHEILIKVIDSPLEEEIRQSHIRSISDIDSDK